MPLTRTKIKAEEPRCALLMKKRNLVRRFHKQQ